MKENVQFKIMLCPACGAPLKTKGDNEVIPCAYCGNSVVPVKESTPVSKNNFAINSTTTSFGGVVKVEGIKTPSSALAYIDLFFEEYDWDAFAYAQALSVAEVDKLANSLKATDTDDKNTWFACFKSIYIPFMNKLSGCNKILSSVIEEYKKDSLDAYSKFDAYKRVVTMISERKDDVALELEKISANAAKYGANTAEMGVLNASVETVKNIEDVNTYNDIKNIPEIKSFIAQKNARIVSQLAAEGIDAQNEYLRAKALIENKNYYAALNILISLKGYADTDELIDKIDKYYLLSDVLEVGGRLYYFKKQTSNVEDEFKFSLYPTIDGKVAKKPIIKSISKIVSNFADILYYLDDDNKLKMYNLASGAEQKIYEKSFDSKLIHRYGWKVYLVTHSQEHYNNQKCDLVELDLATGAVKVVLGGVHSIVSFWGKRVVYTIWQKAEENSDKKNTNVIDLETMGVVMLGSKNITIEGFTDDYVVYTCKAPNEYNKNLYIKSLWVNAPEQLIEQNIFEFCDIIAGKLFYYIGNSKNKSLINTNCNGTDRKEWPLYISELLFEQGGWLYFIRKAGYTSILCKSRLDGGKFSVIAADIDEFINIKNGYLYYINDESSLVKVRMDGSNLQKLCDDVQDILSVKEDKIIFVSVDDRITVNKLQVQQPTIKLVKSIYAVDFSGSGKIKLAYNVNQAKEYDENNVYYIASKEINVSADESVETLDILYKLDVETNRVEKLLILEAQKEKGKSNGFAVAMWIFAFAVFFMFTGMGAEETGLVSVSLIIAIISLFVGLAFKMNNEG